MFTRTSCAGDLGPLRSPEQIGRLDRERPRMNIITVITWYRKLTILAFFLCLNVLLEQSLAVTQATSDPA